MSNSKILVSTTPAVMEFQKLNAMVSSRVANTSQSSEIIYWQNEMAVRTHEICKNYDITVDALITQWESWCASVEVAQSQAKAGN